MKKSYIGLRKLHVFIEQRYNAVPIKMFTLYVIQWIDLSGAHQIVRNVCIFLEQKKILTPIMDITEFLFIVKN